MAVKHRQLSKGYRLNFETQRYYRLIHQGRVNLRQRGIPALGLLHYLGHSQHLQKGKN